MKIRFVRYVTAAAVLVAAAGAFADARMDRLDAGKTPRPAETVRF